jgi:rubrerythrin
MIVVAGVAGWYCARCRVLYAIRLPDGRCPECGQPLEART